MSTSTLEQDPLATALNLSADRFSVELADGRSLPVPLGWYPRLMQGTETERAHWRLLGGGYAIEWPDLDEHIGIASLLAGHRSGESEASLNRWLASRTSPVSYASHVRPGDT